MNSIRFKDGGKRPILCRAYMTVEAAFLLPMVLCIIVVVIYTAFLLYDRCLFYQEAYLLCLQESNQKDTGEPEVDAVRMEAEATDLSWSTLFAVDSMSVSASADGQWAICEGTATMMPAVFGSFFLMPKDIWSISFSAKAIKSDPAWSIRNWRRKSQLIQDGLKWISDTTQSQE